jgi:uncharacterized cupin superfamily protein
MEHVDPDDVDPIAMGEADRRGLSDPLNLSDFAMNRYVLDPGEGFSGGLHAHLDQEEAFYVVEGEATFEHADEPTADTEETTVGAGEAIRFAPGEFQQGRNESDDRVVALAMGAPADSTEVRVPQSCRDCGESDVLAFVPDEDGYHLACPECGTEVEV